MKRIAVFVICIVMSMSSWAGLNEGMDAYKNGDYVTALKILKPLAAKGNTDAQLQLVKMYEYGQGAEQNLSESAKWCTKAAEHGNAKAQLMLGDKYKYGSGVDQNAVEYVRWYTKAAEHGNEEAKKVLSGNFFGLQMQLEQKAEQGDAVAQYNLGWMYLNGKGGDQDIGEAQKWLSKAALQGNKAAQNELKFINGKYQPPSAGNVDVKSEGKVNGQTVVVDFDAIPGPPIPNEIRAITLKSSNLAGCVDARQVQLQPKLHLQTVTTEDFYVIYTIGCMKGMGYNPSATGAMYTQAMSIVLNIQTHEVRWGRGEDYSNAVNRMPPDELSNIMKQYGYGS